MNIKMQRIHPETNLEKKLMCLGAVFIEENHVLDELFQVFDAEFSQNEKLPSDIEEQLLNEISEYFFRLDMNYNSSEIRSDCAAVLHDFWGITDKDAAIKSLENIRIQGHRTKFNVLQNALPADGSIDSTSLSKFKKIFSFDLEDSHDLKMSDEDYRKLAQWIQRTHRFLKEPGILAWDAARYIHLVRLSFIAGYLTDNEAWAEILKLAPLVEGRFETWLEFSQSFLIGRTFWSGGDDPQIKSACERLLGHPASPWRYFSWT